ncbi:MAG: SEC-C metal-binding domain-containing protein [Luteolibacter sp.]
MNEKFEQLLADGLEHEDMMVRSEALNLLAGSRHRNPATTMKALRQLDLHGWKGAFEFPHQVTDLPLSEESMGWLANRLELLAPTTDDEEANGLFPLVNWFCMAPVPLIRPHMDRFLDTIIAAPPPATHAIRSNPVKFANPRISLDLVARRLEAACLPADQCLARLEASLERCAASPDFPSREVTELGLLCETLAQRETVSMAILSKWLDAVHDVPPGAASVEDYRTGAAVLILKHGRRPPPVEALVRLFEIDWDWLNEEIADALSCTGNSSTLGFLLEKYSELPWSARLYLTGVFGRLRFPEHEAALIDMLDREEDEDLCADIARTLILYGSERSIARARKAAKELFPSGERESLVDALYLCDRLGDPSTKEALRHFDKMRKRREQSRGRFDMLERGLTPSFPIDGEHLMQPYEPPTPISPYRAESQIGRNSPCPCGSGKKFKKCCGG